MPAMTAPSTDTASPRLNLGKRLREIRQARELTQRDLARRIGIDDYYISRLENDRVNPTLSTLQKVAEAFQIEVQDLFPLAQPCNDSQSGALD